MSDGMASRMSSPTESVKADESPLEMPLCSESWQLILKRHDQLQVILSDESDDAVGPLRTSSSSKSQPSNQASQEQQQSTLLRSFEPSSSACPLCNRPWGPYGGNGGSRRPSRKAAHGPDSSYFLLLSEIFRKSQTSVDRLLQGTSEAPGGAAHAGLSAAFFNQGYYKKFFREGVRLGRGHSGAVFQCSHVLNDIVVGSSYAIKKIPVGDSQAWLLKMLNEVNLLEQCRHPNVIEYRHAWLEDFQPSLFAPCVPHLFVLMELATGGSLADHLARVHGAGQSLSLDTILALATDVADGLRHLHALDILHRDLKPSNLLLHADRDVDSLQHPSKHLNKSQKEQLQRLHSLPLRVIISDFGEGQLLDVQDVVDHSVSRTGATGTLEYMAPELLTRTRDGKFRKTHSKASDVWSFGIILHELYYGALPYASVSDVDLLMHDIVGLAASHSMPLEFLPRAPSGNTQFERSKDPKERAILQVLQKTLVVDPEKRISMHAVVSMLSLGKVAHSETADRVSTWIDDPFELAAFIVLKMAILLWRNSYSAIELGLLFSLILFDIFRTSRLDRAIAVGLMATIIHLSVFITPSQ